MRVIVCNTCFIWFVHVCAVLFQLLLTHWLTHTDWLAPTLIWLECCDIDMTVRLSAINCQSTLSIHGWSFHAAMRNESESCLLLHFLLQCHSMSQQTSPDKQSAIESVRIHWLTTACISKPISLFDHHDYYYYYWCCRNQYTRFLLLPPAAAVIVKMTMVEKVV